MKQQRIAYGIQGTGNGHLSRAKLVLPKLREHFDIQWAVISGRAITEEKKTTLERQLKINVISEKGFTYTVELGKINKVKTAFNALLALPLFFWSVVKLILKLRADNIQYIISDYEPCLSWAGYLADIPVLALSRQSALLHPENTINPLSKQQYFLLKWFAPFTSSVSFDFSANEKLNIFAPLISTPKQSPARKTPNKVLIYLQQFPLSIIISKLIQFPQALEFHIVTDQPPSKSLLPLNYNFYETGTPRWGDLFNMCDTVICTAGFELPNEALYSRKHLIVVPLGNQFEQLENLQKLNQIHSGPGYYNSWEAVQFTPTSPIPLAKLKQLQLSTPQEVTQKICEIIKPQIEELPELQLTDN